MSLQGSEIVAIVSVITACASAVVPSVISAITSRKKRSYDFYLVHRAEAIEKFLSVAATCVYQQFREKPGDLLTAFGDVSFYIDQPTRELMISYCDLVNHESYDRDDMFLKRKNLFDQIVTALQSQPPRRLHP